MANPWLSVPLSDYEGHMGSDGVQQLGALSDLFGEALGLCRPESVAVIGIAGGNGLDRIDGAVTRRVVGFDINPAYLDEVRRRYPDRGGLELVCLDVACLDAAGHAMVHDPFRLVHAALIFEHAGMGQCLDNALSLVSADGFLSVVLQLPSDSEPAVSKTAFASLQGLSATFATIDPTTFRQTLERRGFRMWHEAQRALPAGKGLWLGIFARAC